MFCAVLPPGQLLLTMCTMVNALLLVQPYVLCSSPSWSTSVDNVYHGECLALSSAICFVQFSLLVNSVDNVYHGECLALSSAICFVQFSLLVNFC